MTDTDTSRQEREGTSARQRASDTYEGARDRVAGAGRRATEGIDDAPLIALAGGLAAGALIAALLPRTEAETRALRPVGNRIRGTARNAAQAAKDAGTSRLSELGLTRDKGAETLRSIFDGASDAVRLSAKAAADAARNRE